MFSLIQEPDPVRVPPWLSHPIFCYAQQHASNFGNTWHGTFIAERRSCLLGRTQTDQRLEDYRLSMIQRKGRLQDALGSDRNDIVSRLTEPYSPENSKQAILDDAIDKSIEHTMNGLRRGVRTILAND